jgi:hypothetical protein
MGIILTILQFINIKMMLTLDFDFSAVDLHMLFKIWFMYKGIPSIGV